MSDFTYTLFVVFTLNSIALTDFIAKKFPLFSILPALMFTFSAWIALTYQIITMSGVPLILYIVFLSTGLAIIDFFLKNFSNTPAVPPLLFILIMVLIVACRVIIKLYYI